MKIESLVPYLIKQWFKRLYIECKHFNKRVHFGNGVTVGFKTRLEGHNKIGKNVNIKNSFIGRGTYIYNNSSLIHSSIGRFCSIGSNVSVVIGQHPTKKYVSTHPAFFSMLKQAGFTFVNKNTFKEFLTVDKNEEYAIKIGNDVWIGFGVMIMEGITIGDGAIIGTGALVTKDIEPYSINVGIPATKTGYRFDKIQIDHLLEDQWWSKDFDYLRQNSQLFNDITKYISQ